MVIVIRIVGKGKEGKEMEKKNRYGRKKRCQEERKKGKEKKEEERAGERQVGCGFIVIKVERRRRKEDKVKGDMEERAGERRD